MGGKVDTSISNTSGPFSFRIHGGNYHKIGSLLPKEGDPPRYLQLYIFDTANEVQNRLNTMTRKPNSEDLDPLIMASLIEMVDTHNHLAKSFRKIRDIHDGGVPEFSIRMVGQRRYGRQYELPTTEEIAGLIVGDLSATTCERDIVVYPHSDGLQIINEKHPRLMSLQYPLLFLYGEIGYHDQIPNLDVNGKFLKRSFVSLREFYAYQFQTRPTEGMTLTKSGRLFHQYAVDAYTAIEQERLSFLRNNQKKLRADIYNNIRDAVDKGDTDPKQLGKRVILPSSFTGGPRYMAENYHDAMAICRTYGNPDLFITMTCNPNWDEITEFLELSGNNTPNDRPDAECRIFKLKLGQLLSDIDKGHLLSPPTAVVYTIEFQKRGLPHAHILLWLGGEYKSLTPDEVDNMISAEIPDKEEDPEGYSLVQQHMMHGPCGNDRPASPCMENGVCTKKYPRSYTASTSVNDSGYVVYRRREDATKTVMKGSTLLDNRYVVPHNMAILKKYKAHINVEVCAKSKAVKYLFKYITKGVDKATIYLERNGETSNNEGTTVSKKYDEIHNYLECRYLSACEAMWRIFGNDIHYRKPSVQRLRLHLEGKQSVMFSETGDMESVMDRPLIESTMFTEWMETNKTDSEARELTYIEFPKYYVWNTSLKIWTKRKQRDSIGRIYNIHPSSGDLYYLRIRLNYVRGPTCFEDIRTVNGFIHKTYRDACYAAGLLDSDLEWRDAMGEASNWATAAQLRRLFVTLLIYCETVQFPVQKSARKVVDIIITRFKLI
ncbi:PREDICTED: uncharacterized protein LOC104767743 [Camelina sativa]|uniref:Uncharacterized protein LOC104767743 n=1 Tax=Camelina sativa TaxID=90675 RepID=A0ABM0XRU2_CAMSA|nr:PREDICTED: uncharacterized protein LOC104767743 [Camelina sativa]